MSFQPQPFCCALEQDGQEDRQKLQNRQRRRNNYFLRFKNEKKYEKLSEEILWVYTYTNWVLETVENKNPPKNYKKEK